MAGRLSPPPAGLGLWALMLLCSCAVTPCKQPGHGTSAVLLQEERREQFYALACLNQPVNPPLQQCMELLSSEHLRVVTQVMLSTPGSAGSAHALRWEGQGAAGPSPQPCSPVSAAGSPS